MKKFALVVIVLIVVVFAVPSFAQTATFRDVQPTHFAFEAINWISDPARGYMVGDAGNSFHPSRNLNKFEAAQIYAMAAGFRHVTHNLPQSQRAEFTRSHEQWRSFLDSMANEYTSWNRTVDREIAFLLYRGILTTDEVQSFVTRTGGAENRPLITRQQAVTWMVRLVGQAPQAQAVTLPHSSPFRDDAVIAPTFRRYVYHAREIGIIQGASGYMNPTSHFTRAEMATVFHSALANNNAAQTSISIGARTPVTVSGRISNIHEDTHISITTATGTETFPFATNVVIMVDNTQRMISALRESMTVTVIVDANQRVISLVARSQVTDTITTTSVPAAPAPTLYADEGFITAITEQNITIRTQRVRITGQIIDEERVFTFSPNALITRGGSTAVRADIQIGDIAFFGFSQTSIHTLELMARERTLSGILIEARPPEIGGNPVLILETEGGSVYELRAQATEFSRDNVPNLNWHDLRIGDTLAAEVEFDRLVRVSAEGKRSVVDGRLNEIRITERNTEITVRHENEEVSSFVIRPGVFDVYTLRIGSQLRINLDSREVVSIQVRPTTQTHPTVVLGFIQTIRDNGTIIVSEGPGATARTHTLMIPSSATITRGGAVLNEYHLRTHMNVYVVLASPGANTVQSITILP